MALEQRAQIRDAIVADGVSDLAGEHEPRPAREAVAPRQRELRVDKGRGLRLGMRWMMRREIGHRVGITPLNRAKEILGLAPELTQVGMHGEMTVGHGQPP
jgi:hypothetical protein